jgi:hypothetical protein
MKKVISAMVVLATVSGALAFKSAKFSQVCVYTKANATAPCIRYTPGGAGQLFNLYTGTGTKIELPNATTRTPNPTCPSLQSADCNSIVAVVTE